MAAEDAEDRKPAPEESGSGTPDGAGKPADIPGDVFAAHSEEDMAWQNEMKDYMKRTEAAIDKLSDALSVVVQSGRIVDVQDDDEQEDSDGYHDILNLSIND